MRGFNFNISTLFSSLGKNDSMGSFSLSDYASIKNGSYGKLMKSYYAEQKKTESVDKADSSASAKPSTSKTQKEKMVDTTGLTQLKKEADGLKTATEGLNKDDLWKLTDGKVDMDKVASGVKNFVKEYNDVLAQADKVKSKDVASSVKYMKDMTSVMSKSLSKIGITAGEDGSLKVDEDQLKNAKASDVKTLFSGKATYGSQIAERATEIAKTAVNNASLYTGDGTMGGSLINGFDKWI